MSYITMTSHERHGVSNHRNLDCLLNRFCIITRRHQKFVLLALWEMNPPLTSGFRSQSASNVQSVSMSWRHAIKSSPCGHSPITTSSSDMSTFSVEPPTLEDASKYTRMYPGGTLMKPSSQSDDTTPALKQQQPDSDYGCAIAWYTCDGVSRLWTGDVRGHCGGGGGGLRYRGCGTEPLWWK